MILASYLRPFDAKQKIYVLDTEHDTEEIRLVSLEHYEDEIMQLITEYSISELQLHGAEPLCQEVKDRILKAEMTKYNNNQLVITLKGE